jgi:tRNA threonylcarbamoyladenosine biosynthesis protein TsaE
MRVEAKETSSAEETTQFGRDLAANLSAPLLVLLKGDLGAGKTTLTKGIISGLGAAREEDVTSPTFALVHVFHRSTPNPLKIYHVDLYRVEGTRDLESLGMEDLFADPAIVIVEWSENLTFPTAWPIIRIELRHKGGDTREILVSRQPANIPRASTVDL